MTPLPYTVLASQSLAAATARMHQLGVRHLPVERDGKPVGVVSDRDIAYVCARAGGDPERMVIEDLLDDELYVVGPEMPLAVVARTMAIRKIGSALVVENGRVCGILTTTDALYILAELLGLGSSSERPDRAMPSEVRARILDEHRVLRSMLDEAEDAAKRVLGGDDLAVAELVLNARELYHAMLRHMTLEDAILAPALREADGYGPARADALEEEHRKQRTLLRTALSEIESKGPQGLAKSVNEVVEYVREDMKNEEAELLTPQILRNDLVTSDFVGG